MTQNNWGILYYVKNDYPVTIGAYSKALEIRERLVATHPDTYEIEMCNSIVVLGLLQKTDYQSARQALINGYLEKAKQILPKYPNISFAKEMI
jgi:hypothetical protein